MRVNESHPPTPVNVLSEHGFEQGSFARSGFSNDINVQQAIRLPDAKWDIAVSEVGFCKVCDVRVHQEIISFTANLGRMYSMARIDYRKIKTAVLQAVSGHL